MRLSWNWLRRKLWLSVRSKRAPGNENPDYVCQKVGQRESVQQAWITPSMMYLRRRLLEWFVLEKSFGQSGQRYIRSKLLSVKATFGQSYFRSKLFW
jgi:hypothetical protein